MKEEALYKVYGDVNPVAVLTLSNWGGIEILGVEHGIEDKVVACFNFGNTRQQIRRHTVNTTPAGRDYIRKQGVRYYLDQFMRV